MDILNVNLNLLKSFWAIYKTGGVIKAAKMLDLAPPAVSYNIKQLEKQLGKKLFITHRKGSDPTEDAKALFPYIENVFDNLQKVNEQLKYSNNGTIRIGLSNFIANFFLKSFLCGFQQKYPNIKLEFHYHPKHDYITELENNRVDIAIMQFPKRPSTEIKTFELANLKTTFFTSKKFAANHNIKDKITFEQFLDLPFIMFSKSGMTISKLETAFGEKLEYRRVPSTIIACDMVIDGQGVGFFSEQYLDAQNTDQIMKFKIKDKPVPPPIIVECAYNKKTSAIVALLVSELKSYYISH